MNTQALRRRVGEWLHQLTMRVRAEIRRQQLPREFLVAYGDAFLEEDLADNAFVYASVQFLRVGERQDGWHTDGGASLLHGALTVFGSRTLLVKSKGRGCISLPQKPGSFYVGNLCALEHNVEPCAESAGCYGEGPPSRLSVTAERDTF